MSLIQRFRNAEEAGEDWVELRDAYLGSRYLQLILPFRFHLAIGVSRPDDDLWNVYLGPLVLSVEKAAD